MYYPRKQFHDLRHYLLIFIALSGAMMFQRWAWLCLAIAVLTEALCHLLNLAYQAWDRYQMRRKWRSCY